MSFDTWLLFQANGVPLQALVPRASLQKNTHTLRRPSLGRRRRPTQPKLAQHHAVGGGAKELLQQPGRPILER